MPRGGEVWRVQVIAPSLGIVARASAVLEKICPAVSVFEATPSGWLLEGFAGSSPAGPRLDVALAVAWAGYGEPPTPLIEKLAPRDWVGENQESFPPRRVGRYFIHGSHHRRGVPAGAIPLLIDAATAFGTGEHATTRGCLIAIDGLARERRFKRILDMGTGTGILAIAAAKTWRARVLAADIDPGATQAARDNAVRNGVARQVRVHSSNGYRDRITRRGGAFDLVLANILARPLVSMACDLSRALTPRGVAVLSGLIRSQESLVLAAHRSSRLFFARRIVIDGWHTLVLRRL